LKISSYIGDVTSKYEIKFKIDLNKYTMKLEELNIEEKPSSSRKQSYSSLLNKHRNNTDDDVNFFSKHLEVKSIEYTPSYKSSPNDNNTSFNPTPLVSSFSPSFINTNNNKNTFANSEHSFSFSLPSSYSHSSSTPKDQERKAYAFSLPYSNKK
jgi:hypothetical protein